jgi:hypothetical protein
MTSFSARICTLHDSCVTQIEAKALRAAAVTFLANIRLRATRISSRPCRQVSALFLLFLLFLQEIISGGPFILRRNPGVPTPERTKEQQESDLFRVDPVNS